MAHYFTRTNKFKCKVGTVIYMIFGHSQVLLIDRSDVSNKKRLLQYILYLYTLIFIFIASFRRLWTDSNLCSLEEMTKNQTCICILYWKSLGKFACGRKSTNKTTAGNQSSNENDSINKHTRTYLRVWKPSVCWKGLNLIHNKRVTSQET